MKEFKDYATMVVEEQQKVDALNKKREVVKQRNEERKRLRDEANFDLRMQKRKWEYENEDIITNVREHFTAEQIANKDYLQNAYESKEDWEQGNGFKNEIEYELTLMKNLLEGFGNRLDMLEGKPLYPYSKVLLYKD